jgi:hypothetical protein
MGTRHLYSPTCPEEEFSEVSIAPVQHIIARRVHFDLENVVTGGPCLNPREILDELDRLGIRVWWSELGTQGRNLRTPKIRVQESAPRSCARP